MKDKKQTARPPAFDQNTRILRTTRWAMFILGLLMLGVLFRVTQLMVRPNEYVKSRVESRGVVHEVKARRGDILDRKGRQLAVSRYGYTLFVDPVLIPADGRDRYILELAHAIGIEPAYIEQRLDAALSARPKTRRVVIVKLLSGEQYEAAKKWEAKKKQEIVALAERDPEKKVHPVGVYFDAIAVREYPQGAVAGQVLGAVKRITGKGTEDIVYSQSGLSGLELVFDKTMKDTRGELHVLRSASRKPMWVKHSGLAHPVDGNDVRVSLDTVIQGVAEDELMKACEEYKAARGEVIVMQARTGQILAMANWPPFDPNKLADSTPELRRNRCVTDVYEPGSVFKPFFFAAALDQGIAKPTELFDSTTSGVWYTSFGRRLRDAHAHGLVSFDKGLIVSSNIVMGKVGLRMGIPKMYKSMKAYGFGEKTGSLIPGEMRGILNPLRNSKGQKLWSKYSLTSVPMGQEVAVTPLQLVRAFSAFANDGMIVQPTIIADETAMPIHQRAVGAWAANHTRQVMYQVVEEGTGRRAKSDLYQIWGKTGTAQVPFKEKRGYKPNAYTANFICGAPLRDPQVIVAVIIHEPDKKIGHYGGVVAAPAAKNVVERSLVYLGVPPDKFEDRKGPVELPSIVVYD